MGCGYRITCLICFRVEPLNQRPRGCKGLKMVWALIPMVTGSQGLAVLPYMLCSSHCSEFWAHSDPGPTPTPFSLLLTHSPIFKVQLRCSLFKASCHHPVPCLAQVYPPGAPIEAYLCLCLCPGVKSKPITLALRGLDLGLPASLTPFLQVQGHTYAP